MKSMLKWAMFFVLIVLGAAIVVAVSAVLSAYYSEAEVKFAGKLLMGFWAIGSWVLTITTGKSLESRFDKFWDSL